MMCNTPRRVGSEVLDHEMAASMESETASEVLAREAAFSEPDIAWLDGATEDSRLPPPPPSPQFPVVAGLRPGLIRNDRNQSSPVAADVSATGGNAVPQGTPRSNSRSERNSARCAKVVPQATPVSNRGHHTGRGGMRPSPWSGVQAAAATATIVPTPVKPKSTQAHQGSPCDRSGRRTPTPQQQGLSRASSTSPRVVQPAWASLACPTAVAAALVETVKAMPLTPSSASACSTSPTRRLQRSRSESASKPAAVGSGTASSSRTPNAKDRGRPVASARAVAGMHSARSTSSGRSASSSRGGKPPPDPWPAAAVCWEVLWLMPPLREALRLVLRQPRKGVAGGPPLRRAAGAGLPPNPADIQKLSEAMGAMQRTLTTLAAQLEDSSCSGTPKPGPCDLSAKSEATTSTIYPLSEPVGGWSGAEQERLSQLESERLRLLRREAELEEPSVDVTELEKVVEQLRSRVTEFEARESRVVRLREECSGLRTRIAALVAATMDYNALEAERSALEAQIAAMQER